jgi:hypothetical protein
LAQPAGLVLNDAKEALAMNPGLRFITSQRFLEFFSLFGLLCSFAIFAQTVMR